MPKNGNVGLVSTVKPFYDKNNLVTIFLAKIERNCFWGFSSAGRAPALQAGGQRFDPANLHQTSVPKDVKITVPTGS